MNAPAPITPRAPQDELLGVRYLRGGDSPLTGFDCFTLAAFVRWHWFGLATPLGQWPTRPLSTAALCALMIRRALGRESEASWPWQRIEAAPGCVVALGRARHGRLHHCGVWLEARGVLHALESTGVVWTPGERIAQLYSRCEFFELWP